MIQIITLSIHECDGHLFVSVLDVGDGTVESPNPNLYSTPGSKNHVIFKYRESEYARVVIRFRVRVYRENGKSNNTINT